MKIPFNYVLVKPEPTDEISLPNGKKLFLSTIFEETKHAPTVGEVLCVPERLIFNEDGINSLLFKTEMEVRVGDRVVFHFLAHQQAKDEGRILDDGFMVRYDSIYLILRGEEIIPINGHLVVEPESQLVKSNIIIPDSNKKKAQRIGKVRYAGKPVDGYLNYPHLTDVNDFPMVMKDERFVKGNRYAQEGDRVYFSHFDAVPLQHDPEIHGAVEKVLLYRMQHKDVLLILDEQYEIQYA